MLRQVIYISRLAPGFTDATMRQVIGVSVRNNRRSDLTGFLLSSGQLILQVLEGTPLDVGRTLARIRDDNRHSDVNVVADRDVEQRRFGSWSMGYVYSLDFADELADIYAHPGAVAVDSLLARLNPDTMTGGL